MNDQTVYDFEFTRQEVDLLVSALQICAEGWAGGVDAAACQSLVVKLKEAK